MKTSSSSNVLGWPQPGPLVRSGPADAVEASDASAPRRKPSGVHRIERDMLDTDETLEPDTKPAADTEHARSAPTDAPQVGPAHAPAPVLHTHTTPSSSAESQHSPRMHSGMQRTQRAERERTEQRAQLADAERNGARDLVQNALWARDTFRSSLPSLPDILGGTAFSPRSRVFAPTCVAIVTAVSALVLRFLSHNAWVSALVWLTPLTFLFLPRQRGKWSLYAAMLWLGFAWLDLVHPALTENHHGQVRGVLSLCVLGAIVLRLRQVYRGMQELSRRDPLTGLLNRRGFEELGGAEMQRASRYGRPIAFALLDVDRFKHINDRYGHATGDRVLQLVAAELRELRKSDLCVRLGGDEFGLLMPETDTAGAELLVARLRQRVHERMREQGWPVTISVGIAATTQASHAGRSARAWRLDAMIAEADSRMYDAKADA